MSRLAVLPAVAAGISLGVVACVGASSPPPPAPTPPPAATVSPPAATVSPVTPSATPATPSSGATRAPGSAPLAPAIELVDIRDAGIRLPVPSTWEEVEADALADPAVRADLVRRYPGMGALMDAAELMGDRAVPAFVALDPAAPGVAGSPGPSVSVLVAQPPVSGPLLEIVAGFIADGLVDTLGDADPARSRLDTPVGAAIRLQFDMASTGGTPFVATAYVVGAAEGTLLITVMGPPGPAPASDPDATVLGATPLR